MKKELVRDNGTPLYQQLVDDIRTKIEDGTLKPNDQLKNEMQLIDEYKISRITVRKALDKLVDEGLIYKRRGIGTFVAGNKLIRSMNSLMGFTETCESNGKKASSEVLFAGLTRADDVDKKLFGLKDEENVIYLKRLRFCDGIPVIIENLKFPREMAFLLSEDLEGSFYKLLAKNNITQVSGTKQIGICYATKEESQLLGIHQNAACLLQKDVSYNDSNKIIYHSKSIINPEKYDCIITLYR